MGTPYTLRHFIRALAAFFIALAGGTVAFAAFLHESGLQAFYRSTITLSLTGIDTKPKGTGGVVTTILLVLAGMAIYGYLASAIVELIAHGVLTGAMAERRNRRMIERMSDHYIICGYGRVGRQVAEEFRDAGTPYVVLDFNPDALEHAREDGVPFIDGTGTSDDDLEDAGLARARGLTACSDSDVDNLYITVSARAARPDLVIVSRASDEDAAKKMLRAGANRVVQPYTAAGQEVAKLMLKPQVAAFLDIVSRHGGPDLRFEEIEITPDCSQAGRTIRETRARHKTGALIVALRKADGTFDTTPDPDAMLDIGDVLIAVGTEQELQALEELFAPHEAVAR
ncbi:MAG TPA: NAD-binding protein [Gaiellaceae bacterium]|nr:NAD-binding protein [Gaiellaceae bacterium]